MSEQEIALHMNTVGLLQDKLESAEAALAEAQREIERLTACLKTANGNHELFERKWYLEQDAREAAQSALATVTRERETAQAQVQEWRGKVADVERLTEVEVHKVRGGTYHDALREKCFRIAVKFSTLGLTTTEPPREKA